MNKIPYRQYISEKSTKDFSEYLTETIDSTITYTEYMKGIYGDDNPKSRKTKIEELIHDEKSK